MTWYVLEGRVGVILLWTLCWNINFLNMSVGSLILVRVLFDACVA